MAETYEYSEGQVEKFDSRWTIKDLSADDFEIQIYKWLMSDVYAALYPPPDTSGRTYTARAIHLAMMDDTVNDAADAFEWLRIADEDEADEYEDGDDDDDYSDSVVDLSDMDVALLRHMGREIPRRYVRDEGVAWRDLTPEQQKVFIAPTNAVNNIRNGLFRQMKPGGVGAQTGIVAVDHGDYRIEIISRTHMYRPDWHRLGMDEVPRASRTVCRGSSFFAAYIRDHYSETTHFVLVRKAGEIVVIVQAGFATRGAGAPRVDVHTFCGHENARYWPRVALAILMEHALGGLGVQSIELQSVRDRIVYYQNLGFIPDEKRGGIPEMIMAIDTTSIMNMWSQAMKLFKTEEAARIAARIVREDLSDRPMKRSRT